MLNRLCLAVIAVLLFGGPGMADDAMPGMTMPAKGSASDRAYATSMQTMMKNMAVKPTGNADQDFVAMMLPHHRGAVDMARVELAYGKDPLLLKLAKDIVEAQDREIAAMIAWQAKHPR